MSNSNPCPDARRWRELLDGTATAEQQAELNAHLETCPACQRVLEGLAGDQADWARTARLARAEKEPALRVLMSCLKDEQTTPAPAAPEVEEDELAFLSPPSRTGLLGTLGPYEVLDLVGRGGMGVVFKAFDPSLHRVVAIKVLAPQLASSLSARRRFIREARAAGSVCHDHVVTIHSVEELNGLPCLVMQYIAGISLQDKIERDAPFGLLEIVRIGMQAAQGLAAAHAQGLIHRDVKPANILLENGMQRVKLTDFSLARAIDVPRVTSTGVVAGTPHYMAPEQARGEPLDHRADLFSLGIVLHAMCTGSLPFQASTTMGVLRQVCEAIPPRIRTLNPELPEWLEALVARLLAKDPADRFQSAHEVADLLGRFLAHLQQPGTVPAPTTIPGRGKDEKPATPPRRNRRALIAAGILGLVALFGASEAAGVTRMLEAAATALRIRTPDGTLIVEVDDPEVRVTVDGDDLVVQGAGPQEVRLKPGMHKVIATKDGKPVKTELVTISRGGKQVVKVSLEAQARAPAAQDKEEVFPPTLLERLQRAEAARQKAEAEAALERALRMRERALTDQARATRPSGLVRTLVGHTGTVRSLAFTPDGRRLLSAGGKGDDSVRLWDVATGRELRRFQGHTDAVASVAVSPDGKHVLSGSADGTLRLWDLETGKEIRVFQGQGGQITAVAYLPDGKNALSASTDQTVRLWEVATNNCVVVYKGHTGVIHALAVAPDGRRFATGSADQTVRIWDRASAKLLASARLDQGDVYGLAYSPDGKTLLCVGRAAALLNAASGKILWEFRLPPSVTGVPETTVEEELRKDATAQARLKRLAELDVLIEQVKKLSAQGDRDPLILKARAQREDLVQALSQQRRELGHRLQRQASCVAFAPDGRQAVIGCWDGSTRLWDVTTGKELGLLEQRRGFIRAVAFSPAGRLVATGGGGWGGPGAAEENVIRLYDLTTRTGRANLPPKKAADTPECQLVGHAGPVSSAVFSPNDKTILSGSGWPRGDGTVRLWDSNTGKEIRRFHADLLLVPETMHGKDERHGEVYAVAFSPNGTLAAAAGAFGAVHLWDVATGKDVGQLKGHTATLYRIAFAPDGRYLVAGGRDRAVYAWEVQTGKLLWKSLGHQDAIRDLAFTPDGKALTSCSGEKKVRLWEASTGKELRQIDFFGIAPANVAISPNGKRLLAGGKDLRLFDLATGKELWSLGAPGAGNFTQVAWAPDGKRVVSADDGVIRVWEVATGKELRSYTGHKNGVSTVAFSSDGHWLLSGGGRKEAEVPEAGDDFALRLWRAPQRPDPDSEEPADKNLKDPDGFGAKPLDPEARLQLAKQLLQDKVSVEAEKQLLILSQQKDDPVRAAQALDLLARLLGSQGQIKKAAAYYRILGRDHANVPVRDGKTGGDLFAEVATDKRFLPYLDE